MDVCGACGQCILQIENPRNYCLECVAGLYNVPCFAVIGTGKTGGRDCWSEGPRQSQMLRFMLGFMQGYILLSVSEAVAGSAGVFLRLKEVAGERFTCSKWEPVAAIGGHKVSVARTHLSFCIALETLHRCSLHVKS